MKLTAAANRAEVVSAVATVVSLIYTGGQVTANTAATRSATASHALDAITRALTTIKGTPGDP
jgi:predicted RNA polymerase sigma factor